MSAAWAESAADELAAAEDPIGCRARELAEQVRVAAPYDKTDLADLAQLVDQLGPGAQ